jgi:hypothetical protein
MIQLKRKEKQNGNSYGKVGKQEKPRNKTKKRVVQGLQNTRSQDERCDA